MGKPRVMFDSSVMIAAATSSESSHEVANDFLARLHSTSSNGTISVAVPAIFFLELFSVLGRQDPKRYDGQLVAFLSPTRPLAVEEVPVSTQEALTLITNHRESVGPKAFTKRGADLLWIAAAAKVQATLVSLDDGMLNYNGKLCTVVRPEAWTV
jgi:predicted nucleic acid-binding protein